MSCVTDVLLGSMAFWTASAARTYSPRAWVIVSRLLFCEQQAPMVFWWSSRGAARGARAEDVGCSLVVDEGGGGVRRAQGCWMLAFRVAIFTLARGDAAQASGRGGTAPTAPQPSLEVPRRIPVDAGWTGSQPNEPVAPGLARATRGRRRFYPGQSRARWDSICTVAIVDCDALDVNNRRASPRPVARARHPLQQLLALLRIAPQRKTAAKQPWASA